MLGIVVSNIRWSYANLYAAYVLSSNVRGVSYAWIDDISYMEKHKERLVGEGRILNEAVRCINNSKNLLISASGVWPKCPPHLSSLIAILQTYAEYIQYKSDLIMVWEPIGKDEKKLVLAEKIKQSLISILRQIDQGEKEVKELENYNVDSAPDAIIPLFFGNVEPIYMFFESILISKSHR